METITADAPAPQTPQEKIRRAHARFAPTLGMIRLVVPAVFAYSLATGNRAYWFSPGAVTPFASAALLWAATIYTVSYITRRIETAGREADKTGSHARLDTRIRLLPRMALPPILLLELPAVFVLLVAPRVAGLS